MLMWSVCGGYNQIRARQILFLHMEYGIQTAVSQLPMHTLRISALYATPFIAVHYVQCEIAWENKIARV